MPLIAVRTPAPRDPARRLALLWLGLALLEIPLGLAGSLPAMAVAITIAGLGIAPVLGLTLQLIADVAPAGIVTEVR